MTNEEIQSAIERLSELTPDDRAIMGSECTEALRIIRRLWVMYWAQVSPDVELLIDRQRKGCL